ncbi:hypothetical protein D0T51_02415 [Parabacteroides sp. 52]|uniref:Imm9 family immunity protein n=1 Tax=unclassified Parabacteroides TaxID=2649774 RepID=UPI0013D56E75|nr:MULTISPECIES: Imm9 family immunity protein [unclassified Parabacteroides]MDH6533839.1 hypothetical protein [Parabacteroides sp. PM5-20]NDV54587.1 hypothetical protein [Parabacteroides sp. 52]
MMENISDWTLSIQIILGGVIGGKEIAVWRQGVTYLADKERYITIRISLPTSDEVSWGIEKKHRFDEYAKRKTDKGFTINNNMVFRRQNTVPTKILPL